MTTQHTPTPWRVDVSASSHRIIAVNKTIAALPDNGSPVGLADLRSGVTQANAAFIVRACNAHDELVAALQAIAEAAQYGIKDADVRAECGEIARAALAKVSK